MRRAPGPRLRNRSATHLLAFERTLADAFAFMSSVAWDDRYGKHGFTKVIGEELCEYHRRAHGLRYVASRPGDLTPWGNDFFRYGQRLLYGAVERDDVLDSIELAIAAEPRTEARDLLLARRRTLPVMEVLRVAQTG